MLVYCNPIGNNPIFSHYLILPSCKKCVCVCACVLDDPPEKQSQLGSILQSQSVGAPEIIDISPLVETCGVFKNRHFTNGRKMLREFILEQEIIFFIGFYKFSSLRQDKNLVETKKELWRYCRGIILKVNFKKMTTYRVMCKSLEPPLFLHQLCV